MSCSFIPVATSCSSADYGDRRGGSPGACGGQRTGRSPEELPGCVMSGKSWLSGHWSCQTRFGWVSKVIWKLLPWAHWRPRSKTAQRQTFFHSHSQKAEGWAKGGLGVPKESGHAWSQATTTLPLESWKLLVHSGSI